MIFHNTNLPVHLCSQSLSLALYLCHSPPLFQFVLSNQNSLWSFCGCGSQINAALINHIVTMAFSTPVTGLHMKEWCSWNYSTTSSSGNTHTRAHAHAHTRTDTHTQMQQNCIASPVHKYSTVCAVHVSMWMNAHHCIWAMHAGQATE